METLINNEINIKTRITLVHEQFSKISQIPVPKTFAVNGILFDLGYSTAQINNPIYGLSYLRNQCLDMRLDRSKEFGPTAAQILNWSSEKALENIFSKVKSNFNIYLNNILVRKHKAFV